MLILVALLATLGYAVQGTLMAQCYRTMNKLYAVAVRGLSLGITMLPLLLLVPAPKFKEIPNALPAILAASVLAAAGNWLVAYAYNYLQVGIVTALSMSVACLCTVLIGFVWFGEILSTWQLACITAILFFTAALGRSRLSLSYAGDNSAAPSGPERPEVQIRGVAASVLCGAVFGFAYALLGSASRTLDPFLAAYLWELSIGLLTAAAFLIQKVSNRNAAPRTGTSSGIFRIALYSAPTVIGTGCYAFATTIGPIGIVTAVLSTMMVFNTLLAWLFYGEKLNSIQWTLLFMTCAAVSFVSL